MSILALAEHDNRSLKSATSHVVTAARTLGSDIHVLIAGHQAENAAREAAAMAGVTKVLVADAPYLQTPTAENLAALIVGVARKGGYTHLLAPATAFGKN